MLKILKRPVQVVWVFRRTQWIALFSTNLELTILQAEYTLAISKTTESLELLQQLRL